jgi:hypothetical protein
MNRRSFMTAMAALLASPSALLALKIEGKEHLYSAVPNPSLPILYGDGVGDDTDAVQALLDGFPVWDSATGEVVPWVANRTLRTTRTVYIDPRRPQGPIPDSVVRIHSCNLQYDTDSGYALVVLPPAQEVENYYLAS